MKLGGSPRPCGGADGRVDCVATATIRARARRGLGERGQLVTAGKGPTWKVAHLRAAHSSGTPRRSNSCVIPEPGGRNGPRPPRGPWMFCWAYHLGPSRRPLRAPGLGVDAVAARCAQALGQQVRSRDGAWLGNQTAQHRHLSSATWRRATFTSHVIPPSPRVLLCKTRLATPCRRPPGVTGTV